MNAPNSQLLPPGMARLDKLFAAQRAAVARSPYPDAETRERRLAALERLLRENAEPIAAAIALDFGHRSAHETRLLELFPSLEAVRHARRRVRKWMSPRRRATSLWFRPGRSQLVVQPLGVVGIIVPWNYPVYLAVGPLVAALAAGNRALVKMSELAPATAELLDTLVRKNFDPDEVSIVTGDADVGRAFAALPFDHLLFTGSTGVGRAVMRAAADNLTPVTLELGGKSPAIVAPDYPIGAAAERIMIGKLMNAGQTCIAPDYALVPAARVSGFVEAARQVVAVCYPDPLRSPDYSSIIDARHFARLNGYIDEARAQGAEAVTLGPAGAAPDAATRRIPPTLLVGAPDSSRVMREEIFGPILPVVAYDDFDAALAYVNARPRPLALYVFDRDEARIRRVLTETVAGGVTINDTILHIAQDGLPFGGVGPSGMGQYHGYDGFLAFSKQKGVFRQARVNAMALFKPPYGKTFERLVGFLLR
ncbi:MAG: coniferyl aldehyde dehydrogenase [Bacteroidota bacterium]|nr:coniferyl aldehyde dehydrogenase [Burkholderiales bacterium]